MDRLHALNRIPTSPPTRPSPRRGEGRGGGASRFLALLFAPLFFLAACEKEGGSEEAPPSSSSRVNAVAAGDEPKITPEEFCDVHDGGQEFAWPPLAGNAPEAGSGWRWINVWATWCKPCVEEVPLLRAWREKLAGGGADVELLFLSADESAEDVEAFRGEHDEAPEGPRVAEPAESLEEWKKSVGLDAGAPIPIHLFVDPEGSVRCARSGSVSETDYPAVAALLGAE